MLLTTKSGRLVELPDDEEDAAINAGIAADPDTYELTDEEFARLERFARADKELISLGLSPDVLAAFRATGEGWQARIDRALREWLETHPAMH